MSDIEYTTFARKPFFVEAVEITPMNMETIAAYIGTVQETPDGTKYIEVDSALVPNVSRAYLGHYVTRMGDYIRCYSPRVFKDQFVKVTPSGLETIKTLFESGL